MNNQNENIGVSSCISGNFEPASNANKWSFCYKKDKKAVTLAVDINPSTILVDKNSSLTAELGLDDVNQLVNWFHQIKIELSEKS